MTHEVAPHKDGWPATQKARRKAPALWRGGKRQPCGLLREAQSAPERGSETMSTTGREVRMIEQPGLLGQRPKATRSGAAKP